MSDLLVNWFGPLANHKQLMFMGMLHRQKGSDFSAGARQIETAKGRGRPWVLWMQRHALLDQRPWETDEETCV